MDYRVLGRTGVKVSNPCLGTMTFGWEPDDWGSSEKDAFGVADAAVKLGINFFDTADVYARGVSEEILGRWMKDRGNRSELVVASKCHGKMSDTDPNAWGNSRKHVVEACEASLRRLGTEWIDLYQIHRPQPDIPIDETLRGLEDLVRAGKIRYAGCSTFAAWQVAEAHYVAKMLGSAGFVSEQPPYNLLDRRIERELIPFCQTYNYAVLPWSPLAGGQLTGKYLDQKPLDGRYSKSDPMGRLNPNAMKIIQKLQVIARKYDLSLTEMSLAWVAGQPGVTTPIVGAKSADQLTATVKACQIELPAKCREAIDKVVEPGSYVTDYYKANFGPGARPNV